MLGRLLFALLLLAIYSHSLQVDSLPLWNDSLLASDHFQTEDSLADSTKNFNALETSGSKTISVVVGDGGTEVDQELRLSMKGFVTDSVYIDAFLSDVGRSAGDQNTATLQEVDQVYFRVESPFALLHLGDLEWKEENFGFLGIERNTLGVMAGAKTQSSEVRGVFGIDETEHFSVSFQGVDGQRSGYVVDATASFLSLVPESETVYLNGKKLKRGEDYELNYAGGVLDFKGSVLPSSLDEIRVEYDAYHLGESSRIFAGKGKYRSKNLWLDVGAFRLESDVERLKRGSLDSTAYQILKNDKGESLKEKDSSGTLYRPFQTDKASARLRFAYANAFLDLETAFYRKDSNTVSPFVKGPEGRAFRWNFQTDSSKMLLNFPLMFGYSGNYIESGFLTEDFSGEDKSYDSYELKENWDLDSLDSFGNKKSDLLVMRFRAAKFLYGGLEWGYKENESSKENSMRTRFYLEHFGNLSESSLSFVHIAAEDSLSSKRYQGILETGVNQGFIRPYAKSDLAYWEREYNADEFMAIRFLNVGGVSLNAENFLIKEEFGSRNQKNKELNGEWLDSLQQISWTQMADVYFDYFTLQHLIQYKRTKSEESRSNNTWLSEQNLKFENSNLGIVSNVRYEFGLTKEQPYVAIYKPVAAGTGDVLYDSTTGLFIEGVDNGNFVYEGMGRSDSLAVEASHVSFDFFFEWEPAKIFKIQQGFLTDVILGLDWHTESYDTSGVKLFFPEITPSGLQNVTSGLYFIEANLGWLPFDGNFELHYYPGTEYEKKDLWSGYTQKRDWQRLNMVFSGRKNEVWNFDGLVEKAKLKALIDLTWNAYEGEFSWKRDLPLGFYVEPAFKARYGEGEEGNEFNALLKEGRLGIGYLWNSQIDVSVSCSAIHLATDFDYLPYSLMSGYDKGLTWRIEANGELSLGDYLSLGTRYILRIGDVNKNIFQKWSMEARAYL